MAQLTPIQLHTVITPDAKNPVAQNLTIDVIFLTPDAQSEKLANNFAEYNKTEQDSNKIKAYMHDLTKTHGLKLQDDTDKAGNAIPALTMTRKNGTRECVHYQNGKPHHLHGLAFYYLLDEDDHVLESYRLSAGFHPQPVRNSEHTDDELETRLHYIGNIDEVLDTVAKALAKIKNEPPRKDYLPGDHTLPGYAI